MLGPYFVHNFKLEPVDEAKVSLDDVNFTYGYGIYETLKVRKGLVYFADFHGNRLLKSAECLGFVLDFNLETFVQALETLIQANSLKDANLKVLCIMKNQVPAWGADVDSAGPLKQDYDLYILALNPLFPKRKDYKTGSHALLFCGERLFPQAKSLNMLLSTLAYHEARNIGAYDALLVDSCGIIREGTRTNLLYTDGKTLFFSPEKLILEGITQKTIMECCKQKNYPTEIRALELEDLKSPGFIKGLCLSSTSSKIMPLSSIKFCSAKSLGHPEDRFPQNSLISKNWPSDKDLELTIPELIKDLIRDYDAWLDSWALDHGF